MVALVDFLATVDEPQRSVDQLQKVAHALVVQTVLVYARGCLCMPLPLQARREPDREHNRFDWARVVGQDFYYATYILITINSDIITITHPVKHSPSSDIYPQ